MLMTIRAIAYAGTKWPHDYGLAIKGRKLIFLAKETNDFRGDEHVKARTI